MKILHVSLGIPPYKTGGLPKYAYDLIRTQQDKGHDVYMLYPGRLDLINKKTRIKFEIERGIKLYEIINPSYIAIPFGVSSPNLCIKDNSQNIYDKFICELLPDIIHIHTFMGIHGSLLDVANKYSIPIIYTTHDYYGICSKTNLINKSGEICTGPSGEKCAICNVNSGPSKLMQYTMQSKWYRTLKNTNIMTKLRIYKRKQIKDNNIIEHNVNKEKINEYNDLIEYKQKLLSKIDYIHYNSNLARNVYEKYTYTQGAVIPITLSDIRDNRSTRNKKVDKLQIGFIGSKDEYKGINILENSIEKLKNEKLEFNLHLFGDDFSELQNRYRTLCINHGRFSRSQLQDIFLMIDLLVVPSKWKETFGIVALESLSFGVPVIVSSNVGAKDLINKLPYNCVFEPDSEELFKILKNLIESPKELEEINEHIKDCSDYDFSIINHETRIYNLYKTVIKMKNENK